MFGENHVIANLAEELLRSFTLEELLEMNDLTEEFVVEYLIAGGQIAEPERIIARFEGESEE